MVFLAPLQVVPAGHMDIAPQSARLITNIVVKLGNLCQRRSTQLKLLTFKGQRSTETGEQRVSLLKEVVSITKRPLRVGSTPVPAVLRVAQVRLVEPTVTFLQVRETACPCLSVIPPTADTPLIPSSMPVTVQTCCLTCGQAVVRVTSGVGAFTTAVSRRRGVVVA